MKETHPYGERGRCCSRFQHDELLDDRVRAVGDAHVAVLAGSRPRAAGADAAETELRQGLVEKALGSPCLDEAQVEIVVRRDTEALVEPSRRLDHLTADYDLY